VKKRGGGEDEDQVGAGEKQEGKKGEGEGGEVREERFRIRVERIRSVMRDGLGKKKGKGKKIGEKVYEMLVKQRAKGGKNVEPGDRVYKCVIVVEGSVGEGEGEEGGEGSSGRSEYRYYSANGTTYGRVGEEFAVGKGRRVMEGGKVRGNLERLERGKGVGEIVVEIL